ncbi:hypothetical protein A1O1_01338 [Capronia coronata CBS 617.96]|uniref:DUF3835 domain-containing protein n=1 Tax=Capronia coronata CBS 617.96 TaxID=1182541 RepID=W9YTI0_9EURO|nr:uncharacterized protein A1O1_01338 [Capronia coronata CBS 617.96]EXJ96212.1 hypothetical protein A1O1_01338 [Capronia coronata CBS 617.96]
MDNSALARVEEQRLELEANIAKLRKSLRHWQTLELDYEGLKEEFLGLPDDSSAEECLQAAKDFKPEVVDDKELKELLVDARARPRQPAQLIDLLSKRVDYVSRNIETVRKQLSDAERKRNALLLAGEPDHQEDAGLPLAEITEELDESGQVISGKVQTPGSSAPQLIDVLKKAGIEDLEEKDGKITRVDSATGSNAETGPSTKSAQPEVPTVAQSDGQSSIEPATKVNDHVEDVPSSNPTDTETEARLRREMWEYSRGMDEVGAIVAELDLEDNASDISYDEQDEAFELDSDFEEDDVLDEDESEDETGKSTHRLTIPRGYRKRMEELQEKLGLKNVGPQAASELVEETLKPEQRPPAAEAARQAAIARAENARKSSLKPAMQRSSLGQAGVKRGKSSKKKVAFSSDLDIASEPAIDRANTATPTTPQKTSDTPRVRPINESIVEREVVSVDEEAVAPAPTATAGKQSRFKAARQSQPQTPMFAPPMTLPDVSSGRVQGQPTSPTPPSKIVSPSLVERPSTTDAAAPDPDDFSEEAHRREIALEYQRQRMKRIHAQENGFLGNGEEDNYGEMITPGRGGDGEDGNEKKISRFKAARINR